MKFFKKKKTEELANNDKVLEKKGKELVTKIYELIDSIDSLSDMAQVTDSLQYYAKDDDIQKCYTELKNGFKKINKYADKYLFANPFFDNAIINGEEIKLKNNPFVKLRRVAQVLRSNTDYMLKLETQLKQLLETQTKADPERKTLSKRFNSEGVTRIWIKYNNSSLDVVGDVKEVRNLLNTHDNYIFEQINSQYYSKNTFYENKAYSLHTVEDAYCPDASKFEIKYTNVTSASVGSLDCVLPAKEKKHE